MYMNVFMTDPAVKWMDEWNGRMFGMMIHTSCVSSNGRNFPCFCKYFNMGELLLGATTTM